MLAALDNYYFILTEDKKAIAVSLQDYIDWQKLNRGRDTRRVALTEHDGVKVSTVFLEINHNFEKDGEPILFETMVFGGEQDEAQERYRTYDEAVAGHKYWCKLAFSVTCKGCKYYHGKDKIICSIHPAGVETEICPDWCA